MDWSSSLGNGAHNLSFEYLTNKPEIGAAIVLPKYQRRGMGAWLLRHCIQIALENNSTIYMVGQEITKKAALKRGWVEVGGHEVDLMKFGGDRKLWFSMLRYTSRGEKVGANGGNTTELKSVQFTPIDSWKCIAAKDCVRI